MTIRIEPTAEQKVLDILMFIAIFGIVWAIAANGCG